MGNLFLLQVSIYETEYLNGTDPVIAVIGNV